MANANIQAQPSKAAEIVKILTLSPIYHLMTRKQQRQSVDAFRKTLREVAGKRP